MRNEKLALFGGPKVIKKTFKRYNSIGKEEILAANKVLKKGVLSDFIAGKNSKFLGGSKVREFERYCAKYFKVKYAVTVNSWTSGLVCAVGAIDIEPGDEIILSPWTMSACAASILHWGAIPIFADIEKETFNLDPKSIIKNISPKSKAILAIDIFGHSCNIDKIKKIADDNNLKVITDSAQAPGSKNKGRVTGTLGDIGGFSLNYHKHIHTGEGGIVVTNNDYYADKIRLIRNHAESAAEGSGATNYSNLIGYNFRLGEIESAIGIEQLKKLDHLVQIKRKNVDQLNKHLKDLNGIRLPIVHKNNYHSYYIYPLILDLGYLKLSRDKIVKALEAEGVQGLMRGYVNLHSLPTFKNKIAYGSKGFPWTYENSRQNISYKKGICPVAEKLHEETFLGLEICDFDLLDNDIEKIGLAFKKVWANLDQLY